MSKVASKTLKYGRSIFLGLIEILCIEPLKQRKYVLQNSIYTKV